MRASSSSAARVLTTCFSLESLCTNDLQQMLCGLELGCLFVTRRSQTILVRLGGFQLTPRRSPIAHESPLPGVLQSRLYEACFHRANIRRCSGDLLVLYGGLTGQHLHRRLSGCKCRLGIGHFCPVVVILDGRDQLALPDSLVVPHRDGLHIAGDMG